MKYYRHIEKPTIFVKISPRKEIWYIYTDDTNGGYNCAGWASTPSCNYDWFNQNKAFYKEVDEAEVALIFSLI